MSSVDEQRCGEDCRLSGMDGADSERQMRVTERMRGDGAA